MPESSIHELIRFGQSVWLDNINRAMIRAGKLKEMIRLGLRGMTSNPTIFDKAISQSADYDERIQELGNAGRLPFEIYDDLTIKDVQDAADIFLPVYNATNKLDGYVSLEINPALAYKADETIKEGKRLFQKVNRPNVMFKVPATEGGFRAIEELTASGLNINATLIFSLAQYVDTANAYLAGIRRLSKSAKRLGPIHSVASVFVSRIDTTIDKRLNQLGLEEVDKSKRAKLLSLRGRAAVSNCAFIYKKYLEIFYSKEFRGLEAGSANAQRVLWASTSTKSAEYSDIKYVTELIAANTVNTMPEATFDAFLDHGKVSAAFRLETCADQEIFDTLKGLGIDINDICARLIKDGVSAFEKSFESLLNSIDSKQLYSEKS